MSTKLVFITRGFPFGLMFHRFYNEKSVISGQGAITPFEFEKILLAFGVKNILSPDEWISRLKVNDLGGNKLCISFDDGLRCQYDICLPILEKYNLKAFWFIYSSVFEGRINKNEVYSHFATRYFKSTDDFFELFLSRCKKPKLTQLKGDRFKKYLWESKKISPFYSLNDLRFRFIRNELLPQKEFEGVLDKIMKDFEVNFLDIAHDLWLTNSQLSALAENGHNIGLHSYDHPVQFSSLPYKVQLRQYLENYNHLSKICKRKIISAAHPFNSYNKNSLKILSGIGILCAFRSNMVPPDGKKINPDCLQMARDDPANILRLMFKTG